MNWSPSSRFVGIVTLLFAACPTLQMGFLGLMILLNSNRVNGDHMPVGVGVPPLSVFLLVALALSSPWIVAGILLLRSLDAGRLLGLLLTIPTFPLALACGGGAIVGQDGGMSAFAFGPIALFGLMFCLTVWWFQISYWRSLKKNCLSS